MCKDAFSSELIPSRRRWYDFPAWLLFHRPVRCRMCQQRLFVFAPASRDTLFEQRSRERPVTFFRQLWMSYAVLILLIGVTSTTVLTPQRLTSIQNQIVDRLKTSPETALPTPAAAIRE